MAELDTSIYGRIRPFKTASPDEVERNALAIENARQTNRMNALRFDEMERARAESAADQETLRAYFQTGGGETNLNALNVRPSLRVAEEKRLLEAAKQREEAAARRATTGKTEGETLDSALKRYRSALDFIDTPQSASRWMQAQYNDAQVAPHLMRMGTLEQALGNIPQDPQQFQQWRQQQAMGLDKFADNQRKDVTERRAAANAEVLIDAQGRATVNPVLVSARRQAAEARRAPVAGTGAGAGSGVDNPNFGRAPAGYRWNPDGTLEAIPGGPAATRGGQPTEDERRSAGLAVRMESSLRRVNEVTAKDMAAAKPGILESAMGTVSEPAANVVRSANRQSVDTAQLDALDAALTLATGAAYTKEQLKGLAKSYFPQLGDSKQVIEDKKQRFDEVIQTARIRAGRSAPVIDRVLRGERSGGPAAQPAGGGMPTMDAIEAEIRRRSAALWGR